MLNTTANETRPRFLDSSSGRLFSVEFPAPPACDTGAAVLIVPPIGEEMNKCRRMLALAARACQAAGITALMIDLHGTGDSAGDFRDGSVSQWRDDLDTSMIHLQRGGARTLHFLAVRSGALLVDVARLPDSIGRLALWQPVLSGRQVVSQWFRLSAAGNLVAGADRGGEQRSRELLAAQGFVEIAGYDLSQQLIRELEILELRSVLTPSWSRAAWFEVVAEDAAAAPSPAASRALDAARAGGLEVDARALAGEPFWATPEISVVPELVRATSDFLAAT
jgi:exosortase A-associated hydrolase 2